MIIDPKSGSLQIAEHIRVASNDSFEKVMDLKLGQVQEVRDMDTGWIWLVETNVRIGDDYFILSFGFCHGLLKRVFLSVSKQPYSTQLLGWDNWSLQEQLDLVKYYNEWLDRQVGAVREFEWGYLGAEYDKKGGGSSVILSYKEQ